jgi:hypothetical protein
MALKDAGLGRSEQHLALKMPCPTMLPGALMPARSKQHLARRSVTKVSLVSLSWWCVVPSLARRLYPLLKKGEKKANPGTDGII